MFSDFQLLSFKEVLKTSPTVEKPICFPLQQTSFLKEFHIKVRHHGKPSLPLEPKEVVYLE